MCRFNRSKEKCRPTLRIYKKPLYEKLVIPFKRQNSEVNNVSKVIITQNANANSSVGQHGPSTNAKVGSRVME
jgi:hypothetical protein